MKRVTTLPNLMTLASAGLGLLAISKAIDALAVRHDPSRFDRLLEESCWLILVAAVLDALDGRIARMMNAFSDFGAQLDSFADAIAFCVAPAMLSKVLLEGEGLLHPRIHFLAAGSFALMGVLRLARYNLETEADAVRHHEFRGLPSTGAAAVVVGFVLLHLSLRGTIEVEVGEQTPVGRGVEFLPDGLHAGLLTALPPLLLAVLPLLGLLMVSRVRYPHAAAVLLSGHTAFPVLVRVVFVVLGLYLAPVPVIFLVTTGYVVYGLVRHVSGRGGSRKPSGLGEAA